MIANFLEERFDHFLILVKQVVHVLTQFVIKQAHFFEVGLCLVVLELPVQGKLVSHSHDILDGRLGVLVNIRVTAGLAQQEFLFAVFIQADVLVGFLMDRTGLLSSRFIHHI